MNIIFNFVISVATKKVGQQIFFHFSLLLLFLDPGSGWTKIRIRDKHPGSATRSDIIDMLGFLYVILLRNFGGIALFIITGEAKSTLGAGLDSNHRVHIFLEYHSVCPLVQIGTPLSRKRVCPTQGGGGWGWEVLIPTTGEKAYYSTLYWRKSLLLYFVPMS
jgi:hypothetical protein